MDTAEIEVFLVLAEELHFGRTAERLRLPQPRVSRLVAALERRAGGALFERPSRRVRLTRLGQQLASQLRPAYAQLSAALDDARAAATREAGVLRIGFSPTSNMAPLTRLAEAFEARHPGSRAVLDVVSNFDPYSALRQGELDVLVNWLAVDEPDLTAGPDGSLSGWCARRGRRCECSPVRPPDLTKSPVTWPIRPAWTGPWPGRTRCSCCPRPRPPNWPGTATRSRLRPAPESATWSAARSWAPTRPPRPGSCATTARPTSCCGPPGCRSRSCGRISTCTT